MDQLPSVKCGIEQAILSLIAETKKASLNSLLNRKSRRTINVNAVIGFEDPESSAVTAEALVEEGYNTLKVKIGRDNFETDLSCLEKISSAVGKNIRLRVDINGKWSADRAALNFKYLEKFNIEYAEQPVNSIIDYKALNKITSIPLAADESVRTCKDAFDFIHSGAVKVLVLKPMMIGGIIPLLKIYEEATRHKVSVVITSSFESGIGRSYAVFAASLIEEDIAHGLATEHMFESRILPAAYPVQKGIITL
jgi:o-succinylbenzoate synthase